MPDNNLEFKNDLATKKRIKNLEAKIQAEPGNLGLVKKILNLLDQEAPDNMGQGPYSLCQRTLNTQFTSSEFRKIQLSKDFLIFNYPKWKSTLDSFDIIRSLPISQNYQGNRNTIKNKTTHCGLYLKMFQETEIINSHCLSCFKVQILPINVFSLIMIYLIMMKIKIPRNNHRKCMIEIRESVSFPYKGYIYCESETEAANLRDAIRHEMEVSGIHDVFYGISHGCSEYGLKYPSFKYSADGSHRSFQRPKDSDLIEEDFMANRLPNFVGNGNKSNEVITLRDMICFETWIKYAKIIGDESYKLLQIDSPTMKLRRFTDRATKQASSRASELSELRIRIDANHE